MDTEKTKHGAAGAHTRKGYTLAIMSQKGGTGKTTTSTSLMAGLAARGFKVLGIDMDAQGNLSHTMRATADGPTIWEVLSGQVPPMDAVQSIPCGGVIISSPRLATYEGTDKLPLPKRELLRGALAPLQENFDFIVVDTPPALSALTLGVLVACHRLIIPAGADLYSLQGVGGLVDTVATIRQHNPSLVVGGVLLTRYSPRSIVTREATNLAEKLAAKLGTKLYTSKIREAVAVKEAQMLRKDIFTHAPSEKVTADYAAFIEELLGEIENG